MGINYYLRLPGCPNCGRKEETLHIGKSSAGWYFHLHVIPEKGLYTLEDWKHMFLHGQICDDLEKYISREDMISCIEHRGRTDEELVLPLRYSSWGKFHLDNDSEFGINNLLRFRISDNFCIGHGEGPWDFVLGEFS